MDGMNVLVHETGLQESMSKIKVNVSESRDEKTRHGCLDHGRRMFQAGNSVGLIAIENGDFGKSPLQNSEPGIKDIVNDFSGTVGTIFCERAFCPLPPITSDVPESYITKHHPMIDNQTLLANFLQGILL